MKIHHTSMPNVRRRVDAHRTDEKTADMNAVCRYAADVFRIPVDELTGKSRRPVFAEPRHAAISAISFAFGHTRELVSDHFNRRHFSVTHSIKRCQELCDLDAEYRARYERVLEYAQNINRRAAA